MFTLRLINFYPKKSRIAYSKPPLWSVWFFIHSIGDDKMCVEHSTKAKSVLLSMTQNSLAWSLRQCFQNDLARFENALKVDYETFCSNISQITIYEIAAFEFKLDADFAILSYPVVSEEKFEVLFDNVQRGTSLYWLVRRVEDFLNFETDLDFKLKKVKLFQSIPECLNDLRVKITDAVLDFGDKKSMELWGKCESVQTLEELEQSAEAIDCTFAFYPSRLFTEIEAKRFLSFVDACGLDSTVERLRLQTIGTRSK